MPGDKQVVIRELLSRVTVSSSVDGLYRMSVYSWSDARTRKPAGIVELLANSNIPVLRIAGD
jgi:hypothetical protein